MLSVHHGTGQVLDDSRALNDVKDAVLRKYGWQARLVRLTDAIKERPPEVSASERSAGGWTNQWFIGTRSPAPYWTHVGQTLSKN